MGGRGGSSRLGGGSGGGWGESPELTGSEKQVRWANDIRQRIKDSIDFNIKSSTEHHQRTGFMETKIKSDLYKDAKKELSSILKNTTKASDIINMRDRLDPMSLNNTINRMAGNMATQVSNGWKYDSKTHRTRRK